MRSLRFRNTTPSMGVVFVDPQRSFHLVTLKGSGVSRTVGNQGTYTRVDGNFIVRDRAPVIICPDDCPVMDAPIVVNLTYEGPQFVTSSTTPVDRLRQAIVDAFQNALTQYDAGMSSGIPPNFSDEVKVDAVIELDT